jgi:hypothetical protein
VQQYHVISLVQVYLEYGMPVFLYLWRPMVYRVHCALTVYQRCTATSESLLPFLLSEEHLSTTKSLDLIEKGFGELLLKVESGERGGKKVLIEKWCGY